MLDLHMIYIEYERGKQKGEFYKKQFVRISYTKLFPCGIVFIMYVLRQSSFCQSCLYFQSAKIKKWDVTDREMR